MTSVFPWQNSQPLICFILYSKMKFACYSNSRCFLTSQFCIPVLLTGNLPGVEKVSRDVPKFLSMKVILNDISYPQCYKTQEIASLPQQSWFQPQFLHFSSANTLDSLRYIIICLLFLSPCLFLPQFFFLFCLLPTETDVGGGGSITRYPSPQDISTAF